jgi:Zn-dependent protease with chaperone function
LQKAKAAANNTDDTMSAAPEMPAAPPPPRGEAFYFDGVTSKRHNVIVEAAAAALRIIDETQSHEVDAWNYADLRARSSPDGVMRLGRRGEVALARLELRDAALAAAIDERAPALDRGGAADRRLRQRVVALSLAAIASVVLTAVFGMPVLANKITPIIPLGIEKKFGEAIDRQVRTMLDAETTSEAFLCGAGAGEAPGRKVLDKLVQELERSAHAPYHFHVEVVRQPVANAFALPGGHIYVYDGLLKKSETVHELAGVIAHEMGHVVHRDGTRTVLESAGLSFLFGMTLGDFVGGGAVVIAAKTILSSSYSRHAEAAADRYSVDLMERAGGDPKALGAILARIAADSDEGFELLRDHPDTPKRIAAINAVTTEGQPQPLLSGPEWKALKAICAAVPDGGTSGDQAKSPDPSKPPTRAKPAAPQPKP